MTNSCSCSFQSSIIKQGFLRSWNPVMGSVRVTFADAKGAPIVSNDDASAATATTAANATTAAAATTAASEVAGGERYFHVVSAFDPSKHVSITQDVCLQNVPTRAKFVVFEAALGSHVERTNDRQGERRRQSESERKRQRQRTRRRRVTTRRRRRLGDALSSSADASAFCANGGKFKLISLATF
jgi:hypothetical protein